MPKNIHDSEATQKVKGSPVGTPSRNRKVTRHKTITSVPSRLAKLSSGLSSNNRKIGFLNTSAESILQPSKQQQTAAKPSENNADALHQASHQTDFNDITPFGGLRSGCGSILHRNSWKSNRSGSGSSNRWPWKNWSHRKESPTMPLPANEQQHSNSTEKRVSSTSIDGKHSTSDGNSILRGRKHKNRHISCPDISSASSESSRSTSPTSFKASLTSIFHRPQSTPSASAVAPPYTSTTANAKTSMPTTARPLVLSGGTVHHGRSNSMGKPPINKVEFSSQQIKSATQSSNRPHSTHGNEKRSHKSTIETQNDHNREIQQSVFYYEVPNDYEHFITDFYAEADGDSTYENTLNQATATSYNSEFSSYAFSDTENELDERY